MKHKFIFLSLIGIFSLTGCSTNDGSSEVASVINSEIEKETTSNTNEDIQEDTQKNTYTSSYSSSQDTYIEPSIDTTLEATKDSGIIEIREELFVTQCVNIYNNSDEYEGLTITLEGMYDEYTNPETGEVYSYIYRNSPGCCGNDGSAGFEFKYDGEKPNVNDWIKLTGVIEVIRFDSGFKNIVINASDIEVLDTRGKEFVTF